MYRQPSGQLKIEDFVLPFEGKLNSENRWVKLSKLIPWEEIEKNYAQLFPSNTGTEAKSLRIALGALIIKEKCGYSDRETVEQIKENPYLQYFIGFDRYQDDKDPFDPSLMVHFRKRLDKDTMMAINEMICQYEKHPVQAVEEGKNKEPKDPQDPGEPPVSGGGQEDRSKTTEPTHKGKLLLDATCAPADVRYPTDLSLLNEAREKTEAIIDALYHGNLGLKKKPRTYRKKARKHYLTIAKQRKPQTKAIRKAIGKQLGYVGRNLKTIDYLLSLEGHGRLNRRQSQHLETIRTLYQQQRTMYTLKIHQIDDRIVSISQPHIRPIVRGKAKASTEFGAKVAISMVDGYMVVDELSWDPFNESVNFQQAVEGYKKRFGYYPEAVLADQIYRNRDNRAYCKKHGIRLSGPALGRPKAGEAKRAERLEIQDMSERNAVEGGFGVGKRRYGLGRIMARLKETAESVIMLQFIVMNLEHRLRVLFYPFYIFVLRRLQGLLKQPISVLS
ncbi:IS5 family transposase [Desulfitobacterium sp. AusDCA]|uniref:IS5 family transposase n=1 Tax=Desulfitobacterium sp. AusDCA TaxID=3240383 RepID=UPI003DA744A1